MKETTSNAKDLIRCTRCILPETFPGISFDEEGVCQHCRKYRGEDHQAQLKRKYEEKFLKLLDMVRRTGTHDVIVAYSGGKDSSYTLDIFVNRYRLSVLALVFDNTFISPRAFSNIETVCSSLGVDLLIVKPDPDVLRKIFATAARSELYPPKTLERASCICTSCISFVKGIVLRTALEKNIPFIGYGWSPGQAPVQASVMQTNPRLMQSTQRTVLDPLLRIGGERILPFFLTDDHFRQPERFPWNIHPLAFLSYDEQQVIGRIQELGWRQPDDTDRNSSNCLLNAYANHVHRQRYGFHPYVWEIANMVRAGVMSRQEGLEKIVPPESEAMIEYSKTILDDFSGGQALEL